MFIRRDEDDIERIFRQRLKHAEEPFPGQLWEGVRQRSSRKRRIPPFWFVAAIVVSGALGFGLYYSDLNPSESAQSSEVKIELPSPASTAEEPPVTDHTSKEQQEVAENLTSASTSPQIHSSPKNDGALISAPKAASAPKIHSTNAGKELPNNTSDTVSEIRSSESDVISEAGTEAIVQLTLESPEPQASLQDETTREQIETPEQTPLNISIPSTEQPTDAHGLEQKTTEPNYTDNELAIENTLALPDSQNIVQGEAIKLPKAPVSLTAASPLSIGIYTSFFRAQRRMSANSENSGGNLISQENGQINMPVDDAEGMAIGLGVQYSLSKWMYLSTGIEYSRMKEHSHFHDIYLVGTPTYINQIDTSWFFTDSDTSVMIGVATVPSDSIWTTNEKTALIFNSYQSFTIPLTAGLSWNHKHLFIGLEAGPVFRFGKSYSGKYRYDDKLIANEASLSPNPYEVPHIEEGKSIFTQEVYSKWNMDWHAALRLGYSITPHFSAQGAMQYRVMKKTTQHDDIGDHRIVMPGISLGLYYRI